MIPPRLKGRFVCCHALMQGDRDQGICWCAFCLKIIKCSDGEKVAEVKGDRKMIAELEKRGVEE